MVVFRQMGILLYPFVFNKIAMWEIFCNFSNPEMKYKYCRKTVIQSTHE